jgi:hypothetical protein
MNVIIIDEKRAAVDAVLSAPTNKQKNIGF